MVRPVREAVGDGAAEGVGSERAAIEIPLAKAKVAPPPKGPMLGLHWRDDGALLIDVGAGDSPDDAPADIWLLGYDRPHETEVTRGENAGQKITDYQAVRNYRRVGFWPGWSLELAIPANNVAALGTGGVAVIVQTAGQGPILAAERIDPR